LLFFKIDVRCEIYGHQLGSTVQPRNPGLLPRTISGPLAENPTGLPLSNSFSVK